MLDEAVLHRRVGGAQGMHAQVGKILDAAQKDQVTVQVVPFDLGAHAAQDSGFVLLEFGEPSLYPVVYVEGLTGSRYVDREADVDLYRQATQSLCDVALDADDSIRRRHELRSLFSDE